MRGTVEHAGEHHHGTTDGGGVDGHLLPLFLDKLEVDASPTSVIEGRYGCVESRLVASQSCRAVGVDIDVVDAEHSQIAAVDDDIYRQPLRVVSRVDHKSDVVKRGFVVSAFAQEVQQPGAFCREYLLIVVDACFQWRVVLPSVQQVPYGVVAGAIVYLVDHVALCCRDAVADGDFTSRGFNGVKGDLGIETPFALQQSFQLACCASGFFLVIYHRSLAQPPPIVAPKATVCRRCNAIEPHTHRQPSHTEYLGVVSLHIVVARFFQCILYLGAHRAAVGHCHRLLHFVQPIASLGNIAVGVAAGEQQRRSHQQDNPRYGVFNFQLLPIFFPYCQGSLAYNRGTLARLFPSPRDGSLSA